MGKKILLADDSITIQKVIELTFSDEDFEVVTVGNGRLAIEKVQEVRPDVVLCDVIMPEKDGYEVCDFIKKSPQLGSIPVLLLTGAFEPFDQERAARVGCDGFLAKPFEPETLIAKVKDLLSKAAARHAPPLPVSEPAPLPPPVMPPPAPVAAPAPFSVSPGHGFAPPPPAPPPFTAAPPPVFAPSAPPPPAEEPEMAFIPDEPFEDLGSPTFDSPAAPEVVNVSSAGPDPVDELLPMTAEETESLSGSGGDASATVMFRADSLPWSGGAAAPPAAPAPVPVPAPFEQPEIVADFASFEEVIEETEVETEVSSVIMTSQAPTMPEPVRVPAPEPVHIPMPVQMPVAMPAPPVFTPPPVAPPPAPVPPPPPVVVAAPAPPPPPPPPAPVVVAPPVVAAPVVSAPVVAAPAVAPAGFVNPAVVAPVFVSAPEPKPAPPPEPAPPEPLDASSFADVLVDEEPATPSAPSVAAQVDVPVDMVAQIAQRVVAQVSEKVVERIAWEVIPELAEALIKREIERLKAELQQLT